MCDLLDLNSNLKCSFKNKKFMGVTINDSTNTIIKIKLENVYCPFGAEYFNKKYIINFEFEKNNNIHNNYISKLQTLENKIINKNYYSESSLDNCFYGKTFTTVVKQSMLGHILRTHVTDSTEFYILRKDNTKMILDKENIKKTTSDIILTLKGLYLGDDNYGFYWNINEVQVKKFHE